MAEGNELEEEEGQVVEENGEHVAGAEKSKTEHAQQPDDAGKTTDKATAKNDRGEKHDAVDTENRSRDRTRSRSTRDEIDVDKRSSTVQEKRSRDAPRSPSRTHDDRGKKRSRHDDHDRHRDSRHGDRREADRYQSRTRDRDRERDRDRDRTRERDRDRDSGREREHEKSDKVREKERGKERGQERDRDSKHRVSDRSEADRHGRGHNAAAAQATQDNGRGNESAPNRSGGARTVHSDTALRTEETKAAPGAEKDGDGAAAQAAPVKATPLSLEEVLKRKKAAEEEAAKPKFLSRKEREQLALDRNKQRAVLVRAEEQEARAALRKGSAPAPAQAQLTRNGKPDGSSSRDTKELQREREIVLEKYLGGQRTKRRIAKASDKFRFNFDWDASEDTHEARLHEGSVLFGRGSLAGIDRKSQREDAAKREQALLSKMRQDRGDRTTAADIQADLARQRRAAHVDDDPVLKERHWSDKTREDMSSRDWRIFREDHRISYKNAGQNAPMPFRSWDEMPLPANLQRAIADLGYAKPSPIQMASIPFGIRQRDVIGLAETGSGKTAAFVLPMLMYIMDQPVMTDAIAADGPYALILAPTRELAQQIEEETNGLAKFTGFRTACIVGGAAYDAQVGQLRRGVEIVVATPGRLGDCLRKTYAVLNQCAYVVLDEADRMIDLGFEPQVMEVLAAMPSSNMKPLDEEEEAAMREAVDGRAALAYRTTYMFSATMPPAVERIAKRYLRRPVTVTVGSAGRATDNVTQRVEWTEKKQKPSALVRALDTFQHETEHLSSTDNDGFKIIVFVNNRENSEDVYNNLSRSGSYRVALLHGGKSQEMREECIKGFRDGEYDIMIATDVAGRGIDVKDVGLVINYDMPHTIENYTHRIGRTGRAGRRGTAVTFLTAADDKTFYDLKMLLEESKAPIPSQLANHEAARIKPGKFEQSKKDTTLFAA